MKFIIVHRQLGREFYDKEFDSEQEAWDFLRAEYPDQEDQDARDIVPKV